MASRKGEQIGVGEAIEDKEQLIQGQEQPKQRCVIGVCPNLKTRYQLSKKAKKRVSMISTLRNVSGFDPISYPQTLKQNVAPSIYGREGLPSRETMNSLIDPYLSMIGVYGMGGVGKNILVREVHRK